MAKWEWFDLTFVDFWEPIVSPSQKWWRDSHIIAHVLGGMFWAFVFRFVMLGTSTHLWLDLRHSGILRILAVGVWQLTFWEAVQRENWRPGRWNLPGDHGYPWLSAIWDVLFTVAGALLLESALWLM